MGGCSLYCRGLRHGPRERVHAKDTARYLVECLPLSGVPRVVHRQQDMDGHTIGQSQIVVENQPHEIGECRVGIHFQVSRSDDVFGKANRGLHQRHSASRTIEEHDIVALIDPQKLRLKQRRQKHVRALATSLGPDGIFEFAEVSQQCRVRRNDMDTTLILCVAQLDEIARADTEP